MICAHCAQQVEQIYEMRNISRNSQTILNNWLNHRTLQSEEKVFIKDAINDSGKSLSVLCTTSSGGLVAGNTNQQPNDLLSSIMQAVGMQVQQQQQQQQQPQQQQPQQQYTITTQPLQHSHSQNDVKSEKQKYVLLYNQIKYLIASLIVALWKSLYALSLTSKLRRSVRRMACIALRAAPPYRI